MSESSPPGTPGKLSRCSKKTPPVVKPTSLDKLREGRLALAGVTPERMKKLLGRMVDVYEEGMDALVTKEHVVAGTVVKGEDMIDHRARIIAADKIAELALGKGGQGEGQAGGKVQVEITFADFTRPPKPTEIDITPK